MMKFLFFFLVYALAVYTGRSQDCTTQAASMRSTVTRSQDNFEHGGGSTTQKPASLDITRIKLNLGKAEAWAKNLLTGFTGAKLDYHNNYFFDPLDYTAHKNDNHSPSYGENFYKATGMKGYYYSTLMFFQYYCYDNKLPIHTEAESGSTIKVIFNNALATDLTGTVGVFTVNGKQVFTILEKKRSEGKIDFYEQLQKAMLMINFRPRMNLLSSATATSLSLFRLPAKNTWRSCLQILMQTGHRNWPVQD